MAKSAVMAKPSNLTKEIQQAADEKPTILTIGLEDCLSCSKGTMAKLTDDLYLLIENLHVENLPNKKLIRTVVTKDSVQSEPEPEPTPEPEILPEPVDEGADLVNDVDEEIAQPDPELAAAKQKAASDAIKSLNKRTRQNQG